MMDRAVFPGPAPVLAPPVSRRGPAPDAGAFDVATRDEGSFMPGRFDHSFEDISATAPEPVSDSNEDERAADRAATDAIGPGGPLRGDIGPRPSSPASRAEPDNEPASGGDVDARHAKSGGRTLGRAERQELEPLLGQTLSDVRIHTDDAADAESRALGARAFTTGQDVRFRRGHFQPHTRAGRWLLTHELTHAIRSHTNLVARNGVGTKMGSAANLRPTTPAEDREFVQDAVDFIQGGKEQYDPAVAEIGKTPRAPIIKTPPISREQLVRQLDGWKSTTTQSLTLIQTTLNNDGALDQRLRKTYQSAVESVVTAAATHQESRHEIFDEHHDRIHDWAWPAAVADPSRNALSDTLTVGEKSQIRAVTTNIALGSVDTFFAANAVPVAVPANTAVRFGPSIDRELQAGLQNIAARLAGIANGLELNSTLTLGLDLGRVGGDYVAYRFTRVHHAARQGQRASDSILIEPLGTIGLERARPGDVRKQHERFTRVGLTLGSGWGASPDFETNAELQAVLRGIAGIPDAAFGRVPGLKIARAAVSAVDATRHGEYDFGTHTVTLFDGAFTTSLTRFGVPGASLSDTTSFTVRHEIGHVLDQFALNTALDTWNRSVDTVNAEVNRPRAEFGDVEVSPGRFNIPPGRQNAWDALRRDIAAARRNERTQAAARDAARGLSGGRLRQQPGTNVFESVQGPVAAGTSEFRRAALQDGVRITHYSDESWLEHFAESYALFVSAPEDLERLRPHVFAFMRATFP